MNLTNPRRILLPGLLATAMLAGACSTDDTAAPAESTIPTESTVFSNDGLVLASTAPLVAVDSCDSLLNELHAIGAEEVGPYGFGDTGYYGWERFDGELEIAEEAAWDDSAATQFDGDTGDNFSGTNNQEVGVDEPDVAKTDGETLVTLSNGTFQVIDVASAEIIKTISLPDNVWADRFFLSGDRILALAQGWTDYALTDTRIAYPYGASTTQILDISIESGEVERTLEVEGANLSARDVDGTARIVLSSSIGQQFDFLYPSGEGAHEAAEKANRDLVAGSTIDQWIPTYRLLDGAGEVIESGPIAPCDRFYIPSTFAGFGTVSVLTVDLDEGLALTDQLAVLTSGQTIYASTERLTVATAQSPDFDDEGMPVAVDDFTTALHSFDISSPDQTSYQGSGSVIGSLLSQYSLSEHNGYLRVASTTGSNWWGTNEEPSESFVTILEESEGELVTVGQVGGLGLGERIFAVRFMGDVGYVVTFEQIDPLYTVDLSDPTAPTVLGELKIPGFSTYLHSIDDGLLLGVGQDGTDDGRTTGSQVSAFDVSDLTNPDRVDALGFGENSYSSIDWDPLAFTWWADTRTAFIPVSSWGWDDDTNTDENNSEVIAVHIDEAGTLTELGRISHPRTSECETWIEEDTPATTLPDPEDKIVQDEIDPEGDETDSIDAEAELAESVEEPSTIEPRPIIEPGPIEEYCWSYQAELQRSIIIDGSVFTVSQDGVQINTLDGLATEKWLPFN